MTPIWLCLGAPGIEQLLPVVDVARLEGEVAAEQLGEGGHAVAAVEGDEAHDLPGENIEAEVPQRGVSLLLIGDVGQAKHLFPHPSTS